MESIYLRTFVEVVKTGNLTRVAELFNVTQPTVSRRIKFLEDQFGKILLDRSGPILAPTKMGHFVLESAQKILVLEQELLHRLNPKESSRNFNFACTHSFGIVHLPDVLREFMSRYLDIGILKFKLGNPQEVTHGLREGIYDAALIEHCDSLDLSEFRTCSLSGQDIVFAGAPSVIPSLPLVPLESLLENTLFVRPEGCCSRILLQKNLAASGGMSLLDFRRLVVIDDLNLIIGSILRGHGIAFIPNDVVKAHLTQGTLLECRVEGFMHQRKRSFIFGADPSLSVCNINLFTILQGKLQPPCLPPQVSH